MRDLTQAIRSLLRTPGFSLTALLALAIGIGAATTVFSVADHMLFRRLPYADPDRLVTVGADVRSRGQSNWAVSGDEYAAWREQSRTLSDLAGHVPFGKFTVLVGDAPVEIAVTKITANFLEVLGVAPARGRALGGSDFMKGSTPAMLLTDNAWRRLFGGDSAIVGRSLIINGVPTEIAGVLPPQFSFPAKSALTVPDALMPVELVAGETFPRVSMIGRLAPGVSLESARSEINALAAARAGESPLRDARIDGATVERLNEALGTQSRSVLLLLLGAVAALVLIGCANIANLLIARGSNRQGELAVRAALGASRVSLVKLLLAESVVLGVAGSAVGAFIAYLAIGAIGPLIPGDLRRLGEATMDVRALAFAVAASLVVVVLAGLGPAMSAARRSLSSALTQASGRATGPRLRLRQVLVAVEVALAVVLLIGGGLMVNSMTRVLGVDAGYTPRSVLTMRVQLPRGKEFPARSKEFVTRVIDAAESVPGVMVAAASQGVPLENTLYAGHYRVEGFSQEWMREGLPRTGPCCTQTQWVTTDFLAAAGIQITRGRGFTVSDAARAPAVALISERLARKFPPAINPVGHYLTSAEEGSTDASDRRLIVGVVRDVRDMSLEREALLAIYLPMEERGASALTLLARVSGHPMSVAGAIEKAVRTNAGPVIVSEVLPLGDVMLKSVAPRHLNAWLFGSFGVLGLVLAVIGVGSVVSYSVARRTREMGLRIALGARPFDVGFQVVRESMVPVAGGLVVGIGAAIALSRFVASLLFGVQPRDVWTYSVVCVVLTAGALVAAVLPARRAARVDPLVALRMD